MKRFFSRFNRQTGLLSMVLLLLLVMQFNPTVSSQQAIYNYVFVIDITQSMNARDYHIAGLPADRLSFVKRSLRHVLQNLPCHSRVSLGLFTNKNMFLLFEPLEICAHYAVIEASLMKIDWRMAWASNSHIARGLYTSIRDIDKIESKPHLVFITDGQQTPSSARDPSFLLTPGKVKGLIIGAGNLQPVPIPRLDNDNKIIGYWQTQEADNPLNQAPASKNYLTVLKENHLQRLAGITGLHYAHLETPEQLTQLLRATVPEQRITARKEINPLLAVIALLLFLLPYTGLTTHGFR